ncbi:MAG: DNA polymerase III subunit delta' [Betaproteobacteria bacterium]|nr:DNA polymerase III subunit delta' [Betaproteobacteria bacterium]
MDDLPWQHDALDTMLGRADLPQALLLAGSKGIGKRTFAAALIAAMLCESPRPPGRACGACPSCEWLRAGSHPDFRLVSPQSESEGDGSKGTDETRPGTRKGSHQIAAEQVRMLADFVNLSAHRAGRKVVLISPAEAMNSFAANSLLKILEEPPGETTFLLLTHQSQRLLPTIRSRCQRLDMAAPPHAQAIAWLESQGVADASAALAYAGGAPLEALDAFRGNERSRRSSLLTPLCEPATLDVLGLAETLAKEEMPSLVSWLQKWVYDLIASRLARRIRYNVALIPAIERLGRAADISRLLAYQRTLAETQAVAGHPLNAQLLLERLFFDYAEIWNVGEGEIDGRA